VCVSALLAKYWQPVDGIVIIKPCVDADRLSPFILSSVMVDTYEVAVIVKWIFALTVSEVLKMSLICIWHHLFSTEKCSPEVHECRYH